MKNQRIIFAQLSLFLTVIINTCPVFSQTWQWAKQSLGTGNQIGEYVFPDNNGNVIIAGTYSTSLSFDTVALPNFGGNFSTNFIAKYDSAGNVLWAKEVGGKGTALTGFIIDNSGNSYITIQGGGMTVHFDTIHINVNSTSSLMAKYDMDGNVLWAKQFDESFTIYSITTDSLNNFYLTGDNSYVTIIGNDTLVCNNLVGGEMVIAKFDSSGNGLWGKQSNSVACGTGAQCFTYSSGRSIMLDKTGNIYVNGLSRGIIIFDNDTIATDYINFITKLDTTRNFVFVDTVQHVTSPVPMAVEDNGTLWLAGSFLTPTGFVGDSIINNRGNGSTFYDDFICKMDANGNVLFLKHYANVVQGQSYGNLLQSIATGPNGIIYANGTSNSLSYMSHGDTYGNFSANVLVTTNCYPTSVKAHKNGFVYYTGGFVADSVNFGSYTLHNSLQSTTKVFTAKLDATILAISENYFINNNNVTAYPNPASDKLIVNAKYASPINFYSVDGRKLSPKTLSNTKGNKVFDVANFTPGIYFIRAGNNCIKFIKQ